MPLRSLPVCLVVVLPAVAQPEPRRGWLHWRGPQQAGTSRETDLPATLALTTAGSWRLPLSGRGTPVIAGELVYVLACAGEGEALHEVLVCLRSGDGSCVWQHRFPDFLNDVCYARYAIGSPTIDAGSGKVACLTSAGLLSCFTADGTLVWQHSLLETVGRMTFPNGRTGAPLIAGGLVVVHAVTAGWGDQAAASDRLFAFDLTDGRAVWQATPGGRPQDNSFASPVVASVGGRRVLYAGMGDGSVACVDARSGEPLWRHPLSAGGVNASAVLRGDDLIVIHGKENLEASTTGGMVALRVAGDRAPGRGRQLWRNDLCSFSSSPVLVDDRVYVTEQAGALCCVDAGTGAVLWREKLGTDQLHASPTWADGRLYVPMHDGTLVVVHASDDGARRLQTLVLEGQCLGAPAIADGRIYVLTTAALYCFAGGRGSAPVAALADAGGGSPSPAHLQIVPCDVLAYPGETVTFAVRRLDSTGHELPRAADAAAWRAMPRAVSLTAPDRLAIAADAPPFTATLNATAAQCLASVRLRVVPRPPFALDFDSGPRPGPPPSWWLGAAGKWEVLELDGDGVLARTLDVPLFQRAQSLIGHPLMSAYTMQVDLRADGNARSMGSVGVIHQRYLIVLKGNHQELEITSSLEVFRRSTAFAWQPGAWYHLRTRVAVGDDGSAVITAKAWPRDAEEPADWTLTARDPQGHRQGAPGIYGFTPQSRHRVYLDNLTVTADG